MRGAGRGRLGRGNHHPGLRRELQAFRNRTRDQFDILTIIAQVSGPRSNRIEAGWSQECHCEPERALRHRDLVFHFFWNAHPPVVGKPSFRLKKLTLLFLSGRTAACVSAKPGELLDLLPLCTFVLIDGRAKGCGRMQNGDLVPTIDANTRHATAFGAGTNADIEVVAILHQD